MPFLKRLSNLIFVIALSLFLGLIAWMSQQYPYGWDWTHGNRNSLATETIALLERFEAPIRVVAYVEDSEALHKRITTVIDRYRSHKADISLRFVNPDLEPELAAAEQISRTGIMLLASGDQREQITDLAEGTIASALQRLLRREPVWLVISEGHGEPDAFDDSPTGLSSWRKDLARSGVTLQPHDTRQGLPVPDNAPAMVIITPQQAWTPAEHEMLQAYLERGGNLLWLQGPGEPHGLDALTTWLGIEFLSGTLIDANLNIQRMLGITNPVMIPVTDYAEHPVTNHLKTQTLFPLTTGLEVLPDSDWNSVPLIRSMDKSWSENGDLEKDLSFSISDGDILGPLNIGIALTRPFEDREQRIIVLGNHLFATNNYLGYSDNQALLRGISSWLLEDQGLLKLTTRKAPDTQLNVDQTQAGILATVLLFGLPALFAFTGILIWWRRRRA
jgi:ABC-type uncharacterized transport system involved in gliding motility auxiliary subunit